MLVATPAGLAAREHRADPPQSRPLTSLQNLAQQARARVTATPRTALDAAAAVRSLGSPETPAFVRALGAVPASVEPMAALPDAVLFKGTLRPEVKAAMGLRIAQVNGSPYVATHMVRVLKGNERGKVLQSALDASALTRLSTTEQAALHYAEALTRTVNIAPSDFERVAAVFNDSEIVELTMTVCFFNFFTRYTEALNLPVESWAVEGAMTWPDRPASHPVKARIALLADDEITAAAAALAAVEGSGGPAGAEQPRPGHGELAARDAARARHPAGLARLRHRPPREGAPSAATSSCTSRSPCRSLNECRYCTLHQVHGLRRHRRRSGQAAGDAQGRHRADAARSGGGRSSRAS